MSDLIKRLSEAKEGSRELDWQIAGCPTFEDGTPNYNNRHYTTSIDAALTLVPEGWGWGVWKQRHYRGDGWEDEVGRMVCSAELRPDVDPIPMSDISEGEGSSPALALTIAALKARASKEQGNG